ncbi:LysE family translocator [Rubellimicrobium arenae]|uniref:LysE family translocator n=1 Tax=Rubellimicrobium arenae TaxID=2817372 RepID=UPI001B317539|nr:LysE family translocator [Rubellimicrobium arenae]
MIPLLEPIATFTVAATILTVTPGLDMALVLRTAASEGPARAMLAGIGVVAGLFGWGLIAAVGLGALLAASELAYHILRWVGAAYLSYLGVRLLLAPRHGVPLAEATPKAAGSGRRWLARGFLTNILNPKVGVFYVSFVPQFIPAGANVPGMTVLLTAIHAGLSVIWFALLILATRPIGRLLRQGAVVAWLDRVTGVIFIVFAARLALSAQR